MSGNSPWVALQPLADRLPRVVREHEILRVAGDLDGADTKYSSDLARKQILFWAQKRSGGRLPENAWAYENFEYLSGGRNSMAVRILEDDLDIWAIRTEDPDKDIPGRVWTTEVVVGLKSGSRPRFSARQLVNTAEQSLKIEPHTPGLVQQIAEKIGIRRGNYRISPRPVEICDEEDVYSLIDMLEDPDRRLPVFVLSVPDDASAELTTLVDADALNRATLGTAHVFVIDPNSTWILSNSLGKYHSVFNGAVRCYLPGFERSCSPYEHRLVLADRLRTVDEQLKCQGWMQNLAASESVRRTRLGETVLAFTSIRTIALEQKQTQAVRSGANEFTQLALSKDRILALEDQYREALAMQDYFDREHKQAEERAAAAEAQARAAAYRIQMLLEKLERSEPLEDELLSIPDRWENFANWSEQQLAGRLVLSSAARRSVRSPDFTDTSLAARCLLWLATTGRDRRISGGGELSEETLEPGIRNAHCGGDCFEFDWAGRRYSADWHIKNGGNTRDPTRCLRIYYCWDDDTRQIIVADMPSHRRTGAT